uniref:Uncharacterized protein n=1 Tax=Cannabis sativa TaxID=3483 RepID=A0A803PJ24_CANSA
MSDFSDIQLCKSGDGDFANESPKSNSFIPTSLSEDEVPARSAQEGLLSTGKINHIVQELEGPITIEVRGSESTVSAQGTFIHPQAIPDTEVKEMGENFEFPACKVEDDGKESESDSIENAPLNELFSYKHSISRVRKFDLTTFKRLKL